MNAKATLNNVESLIRINVVAIVDLLKDLIKELDVSNQEELLNEVDVNLIREIEEPIKKVLEPIRTRAIPVNLKKIPVVHLRQKDRMAPKAIRKNNNSTSSDSNSNNRPEWKNAWRKNKYERKPPKITTNEEIIYKQQTNHVRYYKQSSYSSKNNYDDSKDGMIASPKKHTWSMLQDAVKSGEFRKLYNDSGSDVDGGSRMKKSSSHKSSPNIEEPQGHQEDANSNPFEIVSSSSNDSNNGYGSNSQNSSSILRLQDFLEDGTNVEIIGTGDEETRPSELSLPTYSSQSPVPAYFNTNNGGNNRRSSPQSPSDQVQLDNSVDNLLALVHSEEFTPHRMRIALPMTNWGDDEMQKMGTEDRNVPSLTISDMKSAQPEVKAKQSKKPNRKPPSKPVSAIVSGSESASALFSASVTAYLRDPQVHPVPDNRLSGSMSIRKLLLQASSPQNTIAAEKEKALSASANVSPATTSIGAPDKATLSTSIAAHEIKTSPSFSHIVSSDQFHDVPRRASHSPVKSFVDGMNNDTDAAAFEANPDAGTTDAQTKMVMKKLDLNDDSDMMADGFEMF